MQKCNYACNLLIDFRIPQSAEKWVYKYWSDFKMQEEHSLFLFLFGTFFKPYLTLRKKPLNMAKTCANMKKKMLFF